MQSFTRCMLGDKDEVDLKQCQTVQQTKIDYFVVVVVVFFFTGVVGFGFPTFKIFSKISHTTCFEKKHLGGVGVVYLPV